MICETYDPRVLEGKWQQIWEQRGVFRAVDPGKDPQKRPKYYALSMFPYPSGEIHMGHLRNYAIGDVVSRYKKMQGFNVLQPIGWDAFGLPAENAAISRGVHPREWTLKNIAQMREDLRSMGLAYDWSREITTCLPAYYRWEQLMFRKFYEQGLAYRKKGHLNWCPRCETVLANEQVHDGKCWRCDEQVTTRELSQWYLRITLYAAQLLSGHERLKSSWPSRVVEMQKHWIGESRGCRIFFPLQSTAGKIEVFTTRPDTVFGVTFVTLAPTHPLVSTLVTDPAVKNEVDRLARESRTTEREFSGKKEGVFTGSYCLHPLTREKIPVWVGNFVVMEYGSGAVMAVPGHDERDFEFAQQYRLPVREVVVASDNENKADALAGAYTAAGVLVDSGAFTGLSSEEAICRIGAALSEAGLGEPTVQYRLRDWGISRQRYWGAPIPVIYCDACSVVLVPEKDLPVELPSDVNFTGKGGNPLEQVSSFCSVKCPQCGRDARRETDTMDTFVESSWYYARYTSAHYDSGPFDTKAANAWLPVDTYIGGIEHACMHLLYSRFFHKVMRDWGWVASDEPFSRLINQGMVIKDGHKMSKSKGNVVSHRTIIEKFGADTGRLFSLFAAPPEKDLDWNEKGVEGCHRFLSRVWRLFFQFQNVLVGERSDGAKLQFTEALLPIRRKTHWAIDKMTRDIEESKFNTAIAALMELTNDIYALLSVNDKAFDSPEGRYVIHEAIEALVKTLVPFAPHICEELWAAMGHSDLASQARWPTADPSLLTYDTFVLVVQVNGKMRDKVDVKKGTDEAAIQQLVLELPKIKSFLCGKAAKKVIYVPERLVNVVV